MLQCYIIRTKFVHSLVDKANLTNKHSANMLKSDVHPKTLADNFRHTLRPSLRCGAQHLLVAISLEHTIQNYVISECTIDVMLEVICVWVYIVGSP